MGWDVPALIARRDVWKPNWKPNMWKPNNKKTRRERVKRYEYSVLILAVPVRHFATT